MFFRKNKPVGGQSSRTMDVFSDQSLGVFSPLWDEGCFDSASEGSQHRAEKDRAKREDKAQKVEQAVEFWSRCNITLADRLAEALTQVDILKPDAETQLRRLRKINLLGQSALLHQSDTRWGEKITNAALLHLHIDSFNFRYNIRRNNCS